MKISDNELVVTATKACVGMGVPRGVAEELGKACLCLAKAGKPPLLSLLTALDDFSPRTKAPVWVQDGGNWATDSLKALPFGPSMIDFAKLGGGKSTAIATEVDHPDLIWGLAKENGRAFQFEERAGTVSLKIQPQPDTRLTGDDAFDFSVVESDWKKLCAYAALIMVPADDTNRADAGAGLSDND